MKKVIITGPESSGKTTLFKQLINYYGIVGVIEHSREYIANLKREYNFEDILEIAKVQLNNFLELQNRSHKIIISDTDLLTLEIWCEFKYGKCHKFISDNLRNHLPNIYLLCYPDIPWEDDPQRENPYDRLKLFDIYEEKIKSLGVNSHIIKGDQITRFENVKTIINKL